MAFRSYDPCMSCATHSLPGQMPLEIVIRDADGEVKERLSQYVQRVNALGATTAAAPSTYADDNKTLVLGMGNPILGDDGVGVRIAEEVQVALPCRRRRRRERGLRRRAVADGAHGRLRHRDPDRRPVHRVRRIQARCAN